MVLPGKGCFLCIPVPRNLLGWDAPRLPQAERVPTCSTRCCVRSGGSVSPCSLHVRNSYRPQPGARAPRGCWELQPRQGGAPGEPGLAGRIRAHAQRREQTSSTSRDTGSCDEIQEWSHPPILQVDGKRNPMGCLPTLPAACFWGAGHCCRDQTENKWLTGVGRSLFCLESGHPCRELIVTEVYGCWEGLHPKQSLFCISSWHVSPPSHPKPTSLRLSLCTLRSLVVCGLLSPGWEPAGRSNQGCRKE